LLASLSSIAVAACGGARREESRVSANESSPAASGDEHVVASANEASAAPAIARPPGPLTRAEIEALLSRGLGTFLARIDVSPVLDGSRFVGFRLDRADDLAEWNASGADIHLGDVILRVNGIRIERPEQALWAFERLRIAPAIEVELVRNGSPRTIRSPIVDAAARHASVGAATPRE
jgi:type II secretory pathway component PulC